MTPVYNNIKLQESLYIHSFYFMRTAWSVPFLYEWRCILLSSLSALSANWSRTWMTWLLKENYVNFSFLKLQILHNWVFPKWKRNSVNSENLVNQWSMNGDKFKDLLCYLYLAIVSVSYTIGSGFKSILSLNSANSVKVIWGKMHYIWFL